MVCAPADTPANHACVRNPQSAAISRIPAAQPSFGKPALNWQSSAGDSGRLEQQPPCQPGEGSEPAKSTIANPTALIPTAAPTRLASDLQWQVGISRFKPASMPTIAIHFGPPRALHAGPEARQSRAARPELRSTSLRPPHLAGVRHRRRLRRAAHRTGQPR